MFPEKLQFSFRPTKLLTAIEGLPEVKQKARSSKDRFVELRKRLLQVDVVKMSQWKMKPKMLDYLPYLAAERSNPELWERVLVLTLGGMKVLSDKQLGRLIPYVYHERSVIEAVNARLLRASPASGPRWLCDHWRILRSENPPAQLAEILKLAGVSLFELREHCELPAASPMTEALEAAYWQMMTEEERGSLSFERSLEAISGGLSLPARRALSLWIFEHQLGADVQWDWLHQHHPVRRFIDASAQIFPQRSCPQPAQAWFTALQNEQALRSVFRQDDGMQRLAWWLRWLPFITNARVHRPSMTILLMIGEHCFVERRSDPSLLRLYSVHQAMDVQSLMWQRQITHLPEPTQCWHREETWREEMDEYIGQLVNAQTYDVRALPSMHAQCDFLSMLLSSAE